eukprot:gene2570-3184_t
MATTSIQDTNSGTTTTTTTTNNIKKEFLHCFYCKRELLPIDKLYFFQETNGGLHLEILNNFNENITWYLIDNPDDRKKFTPKKIHCLGCKQKIGTYLLKAYTQIGFALCLDSQGTYLPMLHDNKKRWQLAQVQYRNLIPTFDATSSELNDKRLVVTDEKPYAPIVLPTLSDVDEENPEIPDIYNDRPRDYQVESYIQGILYNTLLVLPTGMGKTLISIMVLMKLHQLNSNPPEGKSKRVAVFLVDRIPLVTQQERAIQNYTDLKTFTIFGENHTFERRKQLIEKNYDVVVATAQTIANLLAERYITINDFHLLIFDECHHATGDHAFSLIMNFYKAIEHESKPRVLGLSASLVNVDTPEECYKKLEEIEKRMDAKVFRPSSLVVAEPEQMTPTLFQPSPHEIIYQEVMLRYLTVGLKQLQRDTDYQDEELEKLRNQSGLRRFERYLYDMQLTNYLMILSHYIKIYQSFSVLYVEGVLQAIYLVEDESKQYPAISTALSELRRRIPYQTSNTSIFVGSSRYQCMINELDSTLREFKRLEQLDEFRCIVFVETRFAAASLVQILNRETFSDDINPKLFVGHAGEDGMDSETQQKILEKFRKGETKLLVATNVLEEGLDVRQCNFVISFDGILSLKSLIQRRGRARAKVSKFIVIIPKEDRDKLFKIINREDIMNRAIDKKVAERQYDLKLNKLFLNWKNLIKDYDPLSKSVEEYITYLSFYNTVLNFKSFLTNILDSLKITVNEYQISDVSMPEEDGFLQFSIVVVIKSKRKSSDIIELIRSNLAGKTTWWMNLTPHFDSSILQVTRKRKNKEPKQFSMKYFSYGVMESPTVYQPYQDVNSKYSEFFLKLENKKIDIEFQHTQSDKHIFKLYHEDMEQYVLYSHENGRDTIYFCLKRPARIFLVNDKNRGTRISPKGSYQSFGKCFVYKLTLNNRDTKEALFSHFKAFGFVVYYVSLLERSYNIPPESKITFKQDLEVSYLFTCLTSRATFGYPIIGPRFIEKINSMLDDDQVEEVKYLLYESIRNPPKKFKDISYMVDNLEKDLRTADLTEIVKQSHQEETNNLTKRCYIKKILLTPSRIIYEPPIPMQTNRILREFGSERFVLVQMLDEGLNKLQYLGPKIRDYLATQFKLGINVMGKHYKFLGSSPSQGRNASAWFYNEEGSSTTVGDILKWAGEIPNSNRKFLRYFGLMFAGTIPALQLSSNQYLEDFPDITRDNHIFTEGNGLIGNQLAKIINQKCNFPETTCAYQIRIGGCKGVLTVATRIGDRVVIRKSMKKFSTYQSVPSHRTVEIISIASSPKCKLNRQIINLLSGLGVPDLYFMELLHTNLTKLARILYDPEESMKQMAQFFPSVTEYEMVTDNYIRRLLIQLYKKQLTKIQEKSSIEIEMSRTLLGVIDHTMSLGPNQVFVQLINHLPNGGKVREVIKGKVIVTKNPCLLPGDIRILDAVDIPQLRDSFIDVLVFSMNSKVPNFKESSGSDLDGDRYFFAYDPNLIPPSKQSMDAYLGDSEQKPVQEEQNPDIYTNQDGLIEQYCSNLEKGFLGTIANSHLAICDKLGISHPYSIYLGIQHFKEVDFQKNGVHGNIPKEIRDFLNATGYPTFMNHNGEKDYESEKVLGKMYSQCNYLSNIADIIPDISVDPELLVPGYESYLEDALKNYNIYTFQMKSLLHRYGAKMEEELLVGFFEDPITHKDFTDNVKFEIQQQIKQLHARYRNIFLMQFSEPLGLDETLAKHGKEIEKKISAWYKVSYQDQKNKSMSFYWIVKDFKKNRSETPFKSEVMTKSLIDMLKREESKMIGEYSRRLLIAESICKVLRSSKNPLFENCTLPMYGSSSLMLFDNDSDLDLYLQLGRDDLMVDDNNIFIQLRDTLRSMKFGAKSIKYAQNAKVPIVTFDYEKLSIDISLSDDGLRKTRYVQDYLERYPFLLPLLYAIIDWGRKVDILKRDEINHQRILNTWSMIWFTLNYCIKNNHILDFKGTVNMGETIQENKSVDWWKQVFSRSYHFDLLTHKKIKTAQKEHSIGEKLLEFFNFYSREFGNSLWKTGTDSKLTYISPLDTLQNPTFTGNDSATLQTLQEIFLIAYHTLSSTIKVPEFLNRITNFGNSKSKVIYKNIYDQLGNERQFIDEVKAFAEVDIHFTPYKKKHRLCKVQGKPSQVMIAMIKINEIIKNINSHNTIRLNIRGGENNLLFQGAMTHTDRVSFEPYKGNHNDRHNFKKKLLPVLKTPYNKDYIEAMLHFGHLVDRQIRKHLDIEDRSHFGNTMGYIRFGSIYMVNIGTIASDYSILELRKIMKSSQNGISHNHERLLQRLEMKSLDDDDEEDYLSPPVLNEALLEDQKRNHEKRLVETEKASKPKSTFYSECMVPYEEMKKILENLNWKSSNAVIENRFSVSVKSFEDKKSSEFKIYVSCKFKTMNISKSIHWMVADLKSYQSKLDENVIDCRFNIQSRKNIQNSKTNEVEPYKVPLLFDPSKKKKLKKNSLLSEDAPVPFIINSKVANDIENIRYISDTVEFILGGEEIPLLITTLDGQYQHQQQQPINYFSMKAQLYNVHSFNNSGRLISKHCELELQCDIPNDKKEISEFTAIYWRVELKADYKAPLSGFKTEIRWKLNDTDEIDSVGIVYQKNITGFSSLSVQVKVVYMLGSRDLKSSSWYPWSLDQQNSTDYVFYQPSVANVQSSCINSCNLQTGIVIVDKSIKGCDSINITVGSILMSSGQVCDGGGGLQNKILHSSAISSTQYNLTINSTIASPLEVLDFVSFNSTQIPIDFIKSPPQEQQDPKINYLISQNQELIEDPILYEFNTGEKAFTLSPNVAVAFTAKGTITLNPKVSVKVQSGKLTMYSVEWSPTLDLQFFGVVNINGVSDLSVLSFNLWSAPNLGKIPLFGMANIISPEFGFPIQISVSSDAKFSASIVATIKTTGSFSLDFDPTTSSWSNPNWKEEPISTKSLSITPSTQSSCNTMVKLQVGIQFGLKFYKALDVSLQRAFSINYQYQTPSQSFPTGNKIGVPDTNPGSNALCNDQGCYCNCTVGTKLGSFTGSFINIGWILDINLSIWIIKADLLTYKFLDYSIPVGPQVCLPRPNYCSSILPTMCPSQTCPRSVDLCSLGRDCYYCPQPGLKNCGLGGQMSQQDLWCMQTYQSGHAVPLSKPPTCPYPLSCTIRCCENIPTAWNIISDRFLSDVISKINDIDADIIVITGDLVQSNPNSILPLLDKHLSKLKSKHGTYAVLGNHDYKNSNFIQETLLNSNIKLLRNEIVYPMGNDTEGIELIGFGDFYYDFSVEPVKELKLKSKLPRIILSHNPSSAKHLLPYDIDLILSGHNHGGQICTPEGIPILQYLNPIFHQLPSHFLRFIGYPRNHTTENYGLSRGLQILNDNQSPPKYLYINDGLGSHPPGRLYCNSEITVISLLVNK